LNAAAGFVRVCKHHKKWTGNELQLIGGFESIDKYIKARKYVKDAKYAGDRYHNREFTAPSV